MKKKKQKKNLYLAVDGFLNIFRLEKQLNSDQIDELIASLNAKWIYLVLKQLKVHVCAYKHCFMNVHIAHFFALPLSFWHKAFEPDLNPGCAGSAHVFVIANKML